MKFSSFDEFKYMLFKDEKRWVYRRILFFRTIGNVLIFSSLLFIFSQFYPVIAAEISYRWAKQFPPERQVVDQVPIPSAIPNSSFNPIPTPIAKILPPLTVTPANTDFGIVVEKINANSVIIPDVDPFTPALYDAALKKGVAQAKGSVNPGEVGNLYLFAHNTLNAWDIPKYNAVFYLLHNLDIDDRVTMFYKGVRHDYIVFNKQIYKPNDLSPLTTTYDEPILSLQTCWPPGTTWQRMVIRARLDK